MDDADFAKIASDPRFQAFVRRRNRFTATLSAVMLTAYFGFLLLIAFDKELLARPVADGVTSLGIVLGFGVILLAIGLTGLYVRRAAADFDPSIEAIRREVRP